MNTKLLRQTHKWLTARIKDLAPIAKNGSIFWDGDTRHKVGGEPSTEVIFACLTLMEIVHRYLPFWVHDGGGSNFDNMWCAFLDNSMNERKTTGQVLTYHDISFIDEGVVISEENASKEFDRLIRIEIQGLLDDFQEYVLDPLNLIEATEL
jgi:hypothetical protein